MGKIIKELNNMNIKLNHNCNLLSFKQTEKILKLINKKSKVIIVDHLTGTIAGDTGNYYPWFA